MDPHLIQHTSFEDDGPIPRRAKICEPRQRLQEYGAQYLSDAELMALVLGAGPRGEDAVTYAAALLSAHDDLIGLARMTSVELAHIPGLGEAKAARLHAALLLAQRLARASLGPRPQISSPAELAALLLAEMSLLEQEHLRVVLLNTKNYVLRIETVDIGTINSSSVRVGEIFKAALRQNAAALIVVHNHPSADATPSPEDVAVTRQLVAAGKLLDVDVLDHLIIGHGHWVSLRERGLGWT